MTALVHAQKRPKPGALTFKFEVFFYLPKLPPIAYRVLADSPGLAYRIAILELGPHRAKLLEGSRVKRIGWEVV